MNEHIIQYLTYFLDLNSPKYAVLINGEWGCGKTFFIKETLQNWANCNSKKRKFHYVTLNGVSSLDDIDNDLFASMHPILSDKKIQLGAKIAKGLVKGTLKINLDDSDKQQYTGRPSLDFNINDIKDASNVSQQVFVFDDLERCMLEPNEVMAYINYMVEHLECNVVIIADIEKFYKKGECRDILEKTIGQQFSLKTNYYDFFDSFVIENITEIELKNYLLENRKCVIDNFIMTNTSSLRLFGGALRSLDRLYQNIKNFNEFDIQLIEVIMPEFIHLSVEYNRSRNIDIFQSYYNRGGYDFSQSDFNGQEMPPQALKGKYGSSHIAALNENISKELISEFNFDAIELIDKLSRQRDEKNNEWINLFNYLYKTKHELKKSTSVLIDDLKSKRINSIGQLLHLVGGFIEMDRLGLLNFSLDDIMNDLYESISSLSLYNLENEHESFMGDFSGYISYGSYIYNQTDSAYFKVALEKAEERFILLKNEDVKYRAPYFIELINKQDSNAIDYILGLQSKSFSNLKDKPDFCVYDFNFLHFIDIEQMMFAIKKSTFMFARYLKGTLRQRAGNPNLGLEKKWFEDLTTLIKEEISSNEDKYETELLKYFLRER